MKKYLKKQYFPSFLIQSAFLRSVIQLPVNAKVPSSLILLALMMEVILSSETSVFTGDPWHHITKDGILHSHRNENLKS
jgi:hypothetical protein